MLNGSIVSQACYIVGATHTLMQAVARLPRGAVVDLYRKWEVYEFVFSLLALSIFLWPQNAALFGRAPPDAADPQADSQTDSAPAPGE